MHEIPGTMQQEAPYPALAEISLSFVDNGFVVNARGRSMQKIYVVQAESSHPDEIENALDVIRKIYHQTREGP
jgi:hypothetical protein